jgi:hypothetical protein
LALGTLVVSVSGHVVGGGSVALGEGPIGAGTVLGGLLLAAIAVAAAETRRSGWAVLGVVLGAQPFFHVLAEAGGHGGASSHAHGAAAGFDSRMVLGHVAAAAVVTVLLTAADRVVWGRWALATRFVRVLRLASPVPWVAPAGVRPMPVAAHRAVSLQVAAWIGWRGPPAVAAAR